MIEFSWLDDSSTVGSVCAEFVPVALVVPAFALAEWQALVLQWWPRPPLTPDQVTLLRRDNVVSIEAERKGSTLAAFGIAPAAMAAIAPAYLWRFRKSGQFRGRVA